MTDLITISANINSRLTLLCLTLVLLLAATAAPAQNTDVPARLEAARDRLDSLQRRSERIRDLNAIENLQRIYGYYTDKMLWDHVVDLFSDDATLEIGMSGVYAGKDSIRKYLYSLSEGKPGPIEGVLYEHLQFQPVITLNDDGRTAQGRWRCLIQAGVYGSGSGGQWGEGSYENEYRKENGIWKISKLRWFATFIAPYEGGWLRVSEDAVRAYSLGRGVTPDRPASGDYPPYPAAAIPPFHFANPVTGEAFNPEP
jgi:hypothetical protein